MATWDRAQKGGPKRGPKRGPKWVILSPFEPSEPLLASRRPKPRYFTLTNRGLLRPLDPGVSGPDSEGLWSPEWPIWSAGGQNPRISPLLPEAS